uniref:Uncharacterized protein n=1 Tax=Cacopsylla melanoneura TaxID=428564 RepID=A0A8D8SFG5_9HEMI
MTFLWTTTFLACVCLLSYYGLVTGEEFDIPLAQDRSGIVWYVEGAPQAAVAAPNPTQPDLTIPTPDMSDTAIPTYEANNPVSTTVAPQANNENTTIPTGSPAVAPQANNENNTAVPTGSNEITTTVATAAVSSVDNATTVTPASATETSPSTPPPPPPAGGLLNGVESLLWGKPNPTPGVTDPDTSNNTSTSPNP